MHIFSISRTNQDTIKRLTKLGYSIDPNINKVISCSISKEGQLDGQEYYSLLVHDIEGATLNEAIENAIKEAGL